MKTSSERGQKDLFLIFVQDLEGYIKNNFDKPNNILCAITDKDKNPELELLKELPNSVKTKKKTEGINDIYNDQKDTLLEAVNELCT